MLQKSFLYGVGRLKCLLLTFFFNFEVEVSERLSNPPKSSDSKKTGELRWVGGGSDTTPKTAWEVELLLDSCTISK